MKERICPVCKMRWIPTWEWNLRKNPEFKDYCPKHYKCRRNEERRRLRRPQKASCSVSPENKRLITRIFSQAQKHAKGRFSYELPSEFEERIKLIQALLSRQRSGCAHCEITMLWINGGHPDQVSIDRKDSGLGYTVDNIQLSCWLCNRAKGNLSDREFYDALFRREFFGKMKYLMKTQAWAA